MESGGPATGPTWAGLPPTPSLRAAVRLLAATLPGTAAVARSDLDAMVAFPTRVLADLPHAAGRVVAMAMIRARVYTGRTEASIELADFEAESMPHHQDAELSPAALSICYSVLSEAYLSAGQSREGNEYARRALDYAVEAADDECTYRASALLACNLALNGEFASSETEVARATAVANSNGWELNSSALPLLLAEIPGRLPGTCPGS